MQIDIVLNPLSQLNNEAVCLDKDKYPRTPAGYVRSPPRSSPPCTMPILPPQEGQVTVHDGSEPRIEPKARNRCQKDALGARGQLPSGSMLSIWWVLKQFAQLLPSR